MAKNLSRSEILKRNGIKSTIWAIVLTLGWFILFSGNEKEVQNPPETSETVSISDSQ